MIHFNEMTHFNLPADLDFHTLKTCVKVKKKKNGGGGGRHYYDLADYLNNPIHPLTYLLLL